MRKLVMEQQEVFCKNVNFRREKHGNEKKMAVDINMRAEVSPTLLNCLVYEMQQSFTDILFNGSDRQKRAGFADIKFDTQFQNYIIVMNYNLLDDEGTQDKRFTEVKIGKFSASPAEGGLVDLEFQIQFNPTSDDEKHWLIDGLERETWKLEVVGPGQMDMLDPDEEEGEEGKEAA